MTMGGTKGSRTQIQILSKSATWAYAYVSYSLGRTCGRGGFAYEPAAVPIVPVWPSM